MPDDARPDDPPASPAPQERRALAPAGGTAELPWCTPGRDASDSELVTVTVPAPSDPDDAEDLRRALARVAAVSHPHIAELLGAANDGSVLSLRFRVPPGSRPLASVIEARALTPGQVVTLGVPWAQGLAALHAARLVAGGASLADVVVDPSGMPLLVPTRVRIVGRRDERDDVAALAEVLRCALGGAMPGLLAMTLLRASGEGREDRPAASAFAAALLTAAPPEPLPAGPSRRAGDDPSERPAEPPGDSTREGDGDEQGSRELAVAVRRLSADTRTTRATGADTRATGADTRTGGATGADTRTGAGRRRPSTGPAAVRPQGRSRARAVRVVAVCVGLAGLAAVALPMLLPSGERAAADGAPSAPVPHTTTSPLAAATPTVTPSPTAPATLSRTAAATAAARADWTAVLGELDRRRSAAFAAGDGSALLDVDLAGSVALADDLAVLRSFAAAGVRAEGFELDVLSVGEVRRDTRTARLAVVDRRRPYRVVDRDGAVVERRPGRDAATWDVVLAADTAGEWRVSSVTRRSE